MAHRTDIICFCFKLSLVDRTIIRFARISCHECWDMLFCCVLTDTGDEAGSNQQLPSCTTFKLFNTLSEQPASDSVSFELEYMSPEASHQQGAGTVVLKGPLNQHGCFFYCSGSPLEPTHRNQALWYHCFCVISTSGWFPAMRLLLLEKGFGV